MQYKQPKKENVCDIDGSQLYQREDDKLETVKQRIRVYEEQTAPLIEYYQKKGLLVQIDGSVSIDDVSITLLEVIDC